MARRRGRVPFGTWINEFSKIQHAVAMAYDTLRETNPDVYRKIANIKAAGAYIRLAINKYVLKRVHKYLASGMPPTEAAKKALEDLETDPNLRADIVKYLKAMGLSDTDANTLVDAVKAVLAKAITLLGKA